jgi:phospholipid/cholesterol/gamma-HCH transport system substrate-binding protein
METSLSKEIKVGIFAGLGVLAFLISIILLGGDKLFLRSTYRLRVDLTDVQGLARGSVVTLEGVPAGNIHALRFMPGSKMIEVTMDLDTSYRNRITEGSKASVKTQGALGDKYIYIEAGPLDGPVLANNALLESGGEGDLLDVLTKKGADLAKIIEVIKEVRDLLHAINENGRSAKLMQNLVSDSEDLKVVLAETRKPIAKLDSILSKIDRGDGTLGALVNDPSLHNRLMQILGGSQRNKFLTPMIRESIKEGTK